MLQIVKVKFNLTGSVRVSDIYPPVFFSFGFSCFKLPEGLLRSVPVSFRVLISPKMNILCAYNNLALTRHLHRLSVFAFKTYYGKGTNIMH